ncbi:hypothetical protein NIES2098_70980 [Calothrix sp. NIES-2098]|nr:hypothetical protein NIES2098_70980 [Calothrix sp. NIES-2098]
MMGVMLVSIFCLLWLVGFTLLAEAWFYEEEQQ